MDVLFKPSPLPSENQPNNVNIILRSASFSVILRSVSFPVILRSVFFPVILRDESPEESILKEMFRLRST